MKRTQAMTTPISLLNKLAITAGCLLALPGLVNAQAAMPSSNAVVSQAVYYGNQAGAVAGAAAACGQSVDVMRARSNEVIGVLAKNNFSDQTAAQGAFEASFQSAKNSSSLPTCTQIAIDFQNLPLLQPDYQATVIAPLRASNAAAATTPATAPAIPPATPSVVAAAPAPTPPANPIFPALSTPAQNYVSTNNPQNYVAPINPGYPPNVGTAANNTAQSTEAAKLQLAQQLAQMAQTLVTPPGQPVPAPIPPQFDQNAQRQIATRQSGSNPIFPDNP